MDQPCPFCETEIERLAHLIICPALWQPILDILQFDLELDTTTNLALGRGDKQERRQRLLALWTAYTVYHNLRHYQGLTLKKIVDTTEEVKVNGDVRPTRNERMPRVVYIKGSPRMCSEGTGH